jgi:ribosome-associated protein
MPPKKTKKWSTLQLAKTMARLADEKLADNIVVLDVGQAIQVADYFVIANGKTGRHINSVAESIASDLKKEGIYRIGGTPLHDENWVLLDFGPVVLHVFSPKSRAFYDLENLWGDCKRIRWQAPVKKAKAAAGDAAAAK